MSKLPFDFVRIKSGLTRISGHAADNQIVHDALGLVMEVERLQAELAAARDVIEAAQGVASCMNAEDHVWLHINGGGCLVTLRDSVARLDAAHG